MNTMEMEVYSSATNVPVIRFPGRNYPGSLIQGDSLSILFELSASIRARARKCNDQELRDDAERLHELLYERLNVYEAALAEHGIRLPYNGPLTKKNKR
jgi:hypothetical protein